jgi:hypothetical protein
MVIFAIKIGLQAFRLKHSRVTQSIAQQAKAKRGEFPTPPPEVEEKLRELEGVERQPTKHRYTVSFAARPCPADPNHVHDLGDDVRPGDSPYTGPYEILTGNGEKYAEGTGPADGSPIPLDDLTPGKYLLRVNVPGTTVTRPLDINQGSSFHLRVVVPHNCTMQGIW